jgi:hypothetical protein
MLCPAMPISAGTAAPLLVVISREFWKAGHELALNRMDAGAGAKVCAVRSEFSPPAPEWIASDPAFWQAKTRKS